MVLFIWRVYISKDSSKINLWLATALTLDNSSFPLPGPLPSVADPGEGPRGPAPAPAPLFLDQTEAKKSIFWDQAPHLSQGLDLPLVLPLKTMNPIDNMMELLTKAKKGEMICHSNF